MKNKLFTLILLGLALASPLHAQVPGIINYQGRVTSGGTNFNGTGQFQFALLGATNTARQATAIANLSGPFVTTYSITDGGAGYTVAPPVTITGGGGSGAAATSTISGGVVISITGTNAGSGYSSPPTVIVGPPPPNILATPAWSNGVNTVSLSVTKGLYSVLLGDTTLANMNSSIPATVFTNADVLLRVWFNDGVNGLQQLSPDQRIAAAGYALNAANVPDGAITSAKIAASAVGSAQLAANAVAAVNIAASAVGSEQLAGGAVTASAIAGGAVGNSALAASSVTSDKIADGTIVDADISIAAFIDASKINHGDLQATRLKVGSGHTLNGTLATIGGGAQNTANDLYTTVGGGYANAASLAHATVGGGLSNSASGLQSAICGGRSNTASGESAFVGGGVNNSAGVSAAVGGGAFNTASGGNSFVGGGFGNNASGDKTFIGGGINNDATEFGATVPGGTDNDATGTNSFAAGQEARAINSGAFVWADSSTLSFFTSTSNNQFNVRAAGGVRFFATSAANVGVQLAPGANAWSIASDRNVKENFKPVDVRGVLEKVAQMPVTEWNLITQDPAIRHIGPMAQDFKAAFGVGEDDKHISTTDEDGVALAAIQGLYKELQDEKMRNAKLEKRLEQLEKHLDQGGK